MNPSAPPRGARWNLPKQNLTGRADSLSFKARASTIQGRALLTYTAPNYFASPNFNLQFSALFDKTRDIQTFDSQRAEGSAQLTQRLSTSSSLLYRYAYRHVTATNLKISAEEIPLVQPEYGSLRIWHELVAGPPQQSVRSPAAGISKMWTSTWR